MVQLIHLPMAMQKTEDACPLCFSDRTYEYSQDKRRVYLQCRVCSLVFVPSRQFLSAEAERKRYDLHQNSPHDDGYRSFLSRLFLPLQQRLPPGSCGLDFGSGPAPTLSLMFRDAGHRMAVYDPYYEPVSDVLTREYDFVTATEVVEHLREPGTEMDRLWRCLKPGGTLGIMTKFAAAPEDFSRWHYKNDLTHIRFFYAGPLNGLP